MTTIKDSAGIWFSRSLWLCISLFSLAWCIWGFCVPVLGDDLIYAYRYQDFSEQNLTPLRHAWAIWLNTNARIGDMSNFIWLNLLPRPLTALLTGITVFILFYSALKLIGAGAGKPTPAIITIITAGLMICMPWHDMDFLVCHFCYVWGSAWCGLALSILFCHKLASKWWLLALPLVFASAATHEALGFPLGIGISVYLLINRHATHMTSVQRWWTVTLLLAALFCISSPASYRRLGEADSTVNSIELIIHTLPIVIILLIRTLWLLLTKRIHTLNKTLWVIFAVTAFVSSGFTLAGGIEGRGGWYAEFFALIALGYDFNINHVHISGKQLSLTVAFAITFSCVIYSIYYATRLTAKCLNEQELLVQYRLNPENPSVQANITKYLNDWTATCMPLVCGNAINTPQYQYTPKHCNPEDGHTADPCIWIIPHNTCDKEQFYR